MAKRLTHYYWVPLPAYAESFIKSESARRNLKDGEFIGQIFLERYPELQRETTALPLQEGEDTPLELHQLLLKLKDLPGLNAAWVELRKCTGKPPAFSSYLEWISTQKKFIKRAGRPGGNQLLLYAVRQMMFDLEGAELSDEVVLAAARNAHARFPHPNETEKET